VDFGSKYGEKKLASKVFLSAFVEKVVSRGGKHIHFPFGGKNQKNFF